MNLDGGHERVADLVMPEHDLDALAAEHGHWAAFDNTGRGDFVCNCGLPWTSDGGGCAFVQGARAVLRLIGRVVAVEERALAADGLKS